MSRRDFARRAALATAGVALARADLLAVPQGKSQPPAATPDTSRAAAATQAPAPPLSPASQAEAEARLAGILRRHGARLSEEQKTDVRRLLLQSQQGLDSVRAFALANADEPATIFRVRGREVP